MRKGVRTNSMRNRIYIAGKISGDPGYLIKFRDAEDRLKKNKRLKATSIVNPAEVLKGLPKDFEHEEYMTICRAMLSMCDSIYLLKHWDESPGAVEEYDMAKAKGMRIIHES